MHVIQLRCGDLGSVNGFGSPKGHNYLRQAGPVISLATVDTTVMDVRSPDSMGIYLVDMETTRLYKHARQRQKTPILLLSAVHFKLISFSFLLFFRLYNTFISPLHS
jgi:hypothetical protein